MGGSTCGRHAVGERGSRGPQLTLSRRRQGSSAQKKNVRQPGEGGAFIRPGGHTVARRICMGVAQLVRALSPIFLACQVESRETQKLQRRCIQATGGQGAAFTMGFTLPLSSGRALPRDSSASGASARCCASLWSWLRLRRCIRRAKTSIIPARRAHAKKRKSSPVDNVVGAARPDSAGFCGRTARCEGHKIKTKRRKNAAQPRNHSETK